MDHNIIVQLIIVDMKNYQLLYGMEKLGFVTEEDLYTTNILEVAAQLMGISLDQVTDDWCETYMDFIFQSSKFEITQSGKNLEPLAEASYAILVSLAKREKWKDESTFHNLMVTENGIMGASSKGLGALLSQYVTGLQEDTQIAAVQIDRAKTKDKVKKLAIEEAHALLKQLQIFAEDMTNLSTEQLKEKYHLN